MGETTPLLSRENFLMKRSKQRMHAIRLQMTYLLKHAVSKPLPSL